MMAKSKKNSIILSFAMGEILKIERKKAKRQNIKKPAYKMIHVIKMVTKKKMCLVSKMD